MDVRSLVRMLPCVEISLKSVLKYLNDRCKNHILYSNMEYLVPGAKSAPKGNAEAENMIG